MAAVFLYSRHSIPHASLSLQTGGGACGSVHAHCTEGLTGSKRREAAKGVGGEIEVGGGNEDGNGVGGGNGNGGVNSDGYGDGAGTGTGTGVEVNEGAQDGNGDGSEDGAGTGTGTGTGTEARTVAEMGTGARITRTGTRIGSGRAERRRRTARNRKIVVDVVWETGETWVERRKM